MGKWVFIILCVVAFAGSAATNAFAQRPRKSVSAAEVNGTFLYTFPRKFRGSSSEIKISALGRGKLRVAFELVYPHFDGRGNLTANMGEADGEAAISADTAIFRSSKFGECTITIRFVKPGTISVRQEGTDTDCGFGHNVTSNGTYKKVSGKKPKFGSDRH